MYKLYCTQDTEKTQNMLLKLLYLVSGLPMLVLFSFLASATASNMEGFIVGGQFASIKNWPFITFIEVNMDGNMASACGGSLLSSQSVLTAAHCLDDITLKKKRMSRTTFTIYMGHTHYDRATMFRHGVDYETPKYYDPKDSVVRYDIGVLFLRRPVKFSDNVKKVILQRRFDYERNKKLAVAGWGMTDDNDEHGSLSHRLKMVRLISENYPKCKKMYRAICTQISNEFPYSGDSGGPMIIRSTRHQVGIVSYRDVDMGMTVFSSVPKYWRWINKTNYRLFIKYCGNENKEI